MQAPRSLGIIGHGDFGRFLEMLARLFAPHLSVRIHSRKAAPDGVRFFSLEQVCQCDVVVIAVSIRAFAEMLGRVLPLLAAGSILVDVNTVKAHPASLLRQMAKDVRYVTTHPMFGPYSFEKQGASLRGLRLVIADHTLKQNEMAAA